MQITPPESAKAVSAGTTSGAIQLDLAESADSVALSSTSGDIGANLGSAKALTAASTSGAIQAAEEKGVKFVGFSADKNGESDCVVGSVSMDWAAVYPTIVENILNGSWTGKTDIGVAEGVFVVVPTDQMSDECVAAVDEAIEQIKNGEIDFEQYFEAAE